MPGEYTDGTAPCNESHGSPVQQLTPGGANQPMLPIIALGTALCLRSSELAAQSQLVGDWGGYWLRAADTMAITLHVKRDPASQAYTASFDSDRLRVMGIPFAAV